MFHHDTESQLLLTRERADLLANEMRAAAAGAHLRGLTRQLRERRVVEGRTGPAGGIGVAEWWLKKPGSTYVANGQARIG